MKRLQLGLTDAERRERQTNRKIRNRFILLVLILLLTGAIEKL